MVKAISKINAKLRKTNFILSFILLKKCLEMRENEQNVVLNFVINYSFQYGFISANLLQSRQFIT